MFIFKPTWLYIKEHRITGMKYLGKTERNPNEYTGSGLYWRRHIRKHGLEYVDTIWKHLFINKDEMVEFAIFISEELNIVKDESWANLMIENGLDGTPSGNSCPAYGRSGYKHGKSKTICINGVTYESSHIASRELGINRQTINYRCRTESSKFTEWKLI